ncbi:MAG: hypothetical protein VW935_13195 [Novosphingobium sp.]|jgi:hypothetical protein
MDTDMAQGCDTTALGLVRRGDERQERGLPVPDHLVVFGDKMF